MLYSLFSYACAPRTVTMPSYEGIDFRDFLSEMSKVKSLESTFSIQFEKDGNAASGDAAMNLTADSLDLQVYSLGFLVAEVTSDASGTKSYPPFDKNKISMLVDGLRSGFFWWDIKKPDITDKGGRYVVSNSWKKLHVDKKTLMPEKQTIALSDDRELTVHYNAPELIDGIWFPSHIRVEMSRYSATLKIKSISVRQ